MNVEQLTEDITGKVEKLEQEINLLRSCLYVILDTATLHYLPKSNYLEFILDRVKITLKPEDPLYERFKSKWKWLQELKATTGGNK